ncbi:hypothetical protein [Nocardiopsis ansamitocini]|uniref:Uncharacterized protein n=1 Tax=Nocardiopsis ansamitocini TaxID=1670832 RepID=A0A9W6P922_9ACTN|nr:hypothetical protein [Nocardiopsis ansamitocini]GLU49844.1 hypothetical protein Nans01_41950 [Nocardiopsis ansamitocini]
MSTPDLLPPVIATAVVVFLLVLGSLRVAAGYRKARSRFRRLTRIRIGLVHTRRSSRKKARR